MNEEIKKQVKFDCERGIKYKYISKKYNISIGTIKSWAHRCKWKIPKRHRLNADKKAAQNMNYSCTSKRENKIEKILEKRLYNIWNCMKQRCNSPNGVGYQDYGGRGIKICEKWNDYQGFYEDMSEEYFEHCLEYGTHDTSIDRINNDGNYEPLNCRWATRKEQANNTRKNITININGKVLRLKKLCNKYNLNYDIMQRINSLTKGK